MRRSAQMEKSNMLSKGAKMWISKARQHCRTKRHIFNFHIYSCISSIKTHRVEQRGAPCDARLICRPAGLRTQLRDHEAVPLESDKLMMR